MYYYFINLTLIINKFFKAFIFKKEIIFKKIKLKY